MSIDNRQESQPGHPEPQPGHPEPQPEGHDEHPEFERLKALLVATNERLDAGQEPEDVAATAHSLLDPGGGY
jgi:hypothetical protein